MARWSVTEVVGLAPDARSVAAARGLARPGRWSELGCTESLVWGRCQGSGKEPYQVSVDLAEPAFRCTCPSRKLPCKHGLALLLLWVEGAGSVADVEAAPGRDADPVATRPRAGAATRATAPDPEARAKRIAARLALMDAGLDDHERWLADLVRQGLGTARTLPYASWDGAAARLVDAQVPRLAERVRALGGAVHARADWPDHLLAELGRCQLAARAWRRRDELPGDVAGDVRAVLGWPVPSEEVRAGARTADLWHVVGMRRAGDDRVQSQRTWLRGTTTGRVVVLLDFAAAAGTLEVTHVLGALVEGEVVEYPGSAPRRAILLDGHRVTGARALGCGGRGGEEGDGLGDVDAALEAVAAAVAADPFVGGVPVWLGGVVVARDRAGSPVIADADDRSLPLHPAVDVAGLLALTGARPFDAMAEWDDGWLVPLSATIDGVLVAVPIDDEARAPGSAVSATSEHWSALVSAALVGTDRRAVPTADHRMLDLPADLSAPSRLLLDAAVEDARRRAGSRSDPVGDRIVAAPDDRGAEAPEAAVQLLELVLGGAAGLTTGRDPVLSAWFDAVTTAGCRAPHRLVTRLLDLASRDDRWREQVAAAVGARGRWLAGEVPTWAWALDASAPGPDLATRWATGTATARRRVLAAARAADPAAARELLASTWGSETAADRAAFVDLLETGISDADEAFLEAALADRSKSVRSRAARLLDHLPRSRRAARLTLRLDALVSRSGDRRGALTVELPTDPSREQSADLPGGPPPKGLGARAWQLAEIVAGTPLDRWADWADADPRRTIELADARAELVSGWTRAAVAQRRPDWAAALLVVRPLPELVGVLDPADRSGAASWLLDAADPTVVAGLLAAVDAPWPHSLTARVLGWFDTAKVPPPVGVAVAELVAARASSDDAPVLDEWLGSRPQQDLTRRALRAAHHALTLRAAVHEAFATPPTASPELQEHP